MVRDIKRGFWATAGALKEEKRQHCKHSRRSKVIEKQGAAWSCQNGANTCWDLGQHKKKFGDRGETMRKLAPGYPRHNILGCSKLRCAYMISCFNHVRLFKTPWTVVPRLLCQWDSPGKNTGVGCHVLLQGIFLTQGSNPRLLRLLYWQAGSYHEHHPGSPLLY